MISRHSATALRNASISIVGSFNELDFSPEEIDLAVRGGFREITLGSQRLRTETAAVMATALVAAANESEIGTDDRQPSSKPVQ